MEGQTSHFNIDNALVNDRLLKHLNSFNVDEIENLEKVLSFPDVYLYKKYM